MRVLVSPRVDRLLRGGGGAAGRPAKMVAETLAARENALVSLAESGARDLSRTLSAAEVAVVRAALAPERSPGCAGESVVGFVCTGSLLAGAAVGLRTPDAIAVRDHANLTWRSPLTGPNDERVGPRFPSMTGVYLPEVVLERVLAPGGIIVEPGVVAGVEDQSRLTPFEREMAQAGGCVAASAELAPVVILAAHIGLRVAAVVVVTGTDEEETDSGRS